MQEIVGGYIEPIRLNDGRMIIVEEFKERIKNGGFYLCHWDGTAETEAKIKEETQATIRCVPFMFEQTPGVDMVSGKPATQRVIIARSY